MIRFIKNLYYSWLSKKEKEVPRYLKGK